MPCWAASRAQFTILLWCHGLAVSAIVSMLYDLFEGVSNLALPLVAVAANDLDTHDDSAARVSCRRYFRRQRASRSAFFKDLEQRAYGHRASARLSIER